MLMVHPDPQPETILEQEKMPPGSAAKIENAHAFGYDVLQELELCAQEVLDLGRLRGWAMARFSNPPA